MRRAFLQIATVLIGCLPFAILGTAGAAFLTQTPRQPPTSPWVFAGQLADLPADGTPQLVAVQVPQRDAWARLPDRRLGFIFLRRLPSGHAVALRAEHHRFFRIPVVYDPQQRNFRSTCWSVQFNLDGGEIAAESASMGDAMQAVPARVRDQAVFVRYEQPDGNRAVCVERRTSGS